MLAMWILLGLLVIGLLVILAASWRLCGTVVAPKRPGPKEMFDAEVQRGRIDRAKWDGEYRREEFFVESPRGYRLCCALIPAKEGASFADGRRRVVIFAHGYGFSLAGSVKYVDIFRDLGFACILYDHRNHGRSDKATTTMGHFESLDLCCIVDWARSRFGEDAVVGTHGESMGAATVMLHAALDPKLAFVVEDCGYSDLYAELGHCTVRDMHLPRFPFLQIACVMAYFRTGVWFPHVVPKHAVAKSGGVPMLFVHGDSDDFVPTRMIYEVYEAKRTGKKRLRVFPNSAHAQSFWNNKAAYTEEVTAFLRENGVI